MARLPAPIHETIGFEVYERWVDYSAGQDVVPEPFVFWEKVLVARDKYPMSRGSFQHWLMRLQMGREPLVWRDETTGAWKLRDLDIARK